MWKETRLIQTVVLTEFIEIPAEKNVAKEEDKLLNSKRNWQHLQFDP